MSVVVRHQPIGLTKEKYDEVSRRMEESGDWPADGLDIHVCFGSEGDLRVRYGTRRSSFRRSASASFRR